jgi:hypothetical protein
VDPKCVLDSLQQDHKEFLDPLLNGHSLPKITERERRFSGREKYTRIIDEASFQISKEIQNRQWEKGTEDDVLSRFCSPGMNVSIVDDTEKNVWNVTSSRTFSKESLSGDLCQKKITCNFDLYDLLEKNGSHLKVLPEKTLAMTSKVPYCLNDKDEVPWILDL